MRQYFCAIAILILLASCSSRSKNENISESSDSTYIGLTRDEREYLTARDIYVSQLQRIQKKKLPKDNFDSLYKAERQAMSVLENKLREILKASRFSSKGEINLETLLGYLGFGMLDGLSFRKDSTTRIFYTTTDLCLNYLKVNAKVSPFETQNSDAFANIFNSAFQSDVHVESYSFVKLQASKNIMAYGMVAGLSQMIGPQRPQHIYIFVSTDAFVYMAEVELKEPMQEIPKCKSVWDSVHVLAERNLEAYRASELRDTTSFNNGIELDEVAFKKYCECYDRELKNGGLIVPVQKQMELISSYLAQQ